MKKKSIFMGLLIVLLVMLLWCMYLSYFIKSDKMLIKHLFGVSKTDYEIINVDNTLSNYNYMGDYKVKIRVKEEDMESFIKEIEKKVYILDIDKYNIEMYSDIFNDIKGREFKASDVIYEKFSSVRRIIIKFYESRPKTVYTYVMYSEAVDGIYEIYLAYLE